MCSGFEIKNGAISSGSEIEIFCNENRTFWVKETSLLKPLHLGYQFIEISYKMVDKKTGHDV